MLCYISSNLLLFSLILKGFCIHEADVIGSCDICREWGKIRRSRNERPASVVIWISFTLVLWYCWLSITTCPIIQRYLFEYLLVNDSKAKTENSQLSSIVVIPWHLCAISVLVHVVANLHSLFCTTVSMLHVLYLSEWRLDAWCRQLYTSPRCEYL